jgi:hypothetical protein
MEGSAIDPALLVNMTLAQPPLGKQSNFINPENFKTQTEISMNLCMAIGAVFIILRLYVKICITKMYGLDDGKQPSFEFRDNKALTNISSVVYTSICESPCRNCVGVLLISLRRPPS